MDLMEECKKIAEINSQKIWLNSLISDIQKELVRNSPQVPPKEIDFYKYVIEKEKIKRFKDIVKNLQEEKEIFREELGDFKVIAKKRKYIGASDLKNSVKYNHSLTPLFNNHYKEPYAYLKELLNLSGADGDFHKWFVKLEYKILNKHDTPVSGGERSEFNLLDEIQDALQYDLLLIDEPESSFDNLFLKSAVNKLIKDISLQIPVVVVTHNNTVGASIKPDYILYTEKIIENQKPYYNVYYGYPSSKKLSSLDGKTIVSYEKILDCLEAGEDSYFERRDFAYEILKD